MKQIDERRNKQTERSQSNTSSTTTKGDRKIFMGDSTRHMSGLPEQLRERDGAIIQDGADEAVGEPECGEGVSATMALLRVDGESQ